MFSSRVLHRHIGGLENNVTVDTLLIELHRHIGGLENRDYVFYQ